jgi:hypothetical protein
MSAESDWLTAMQQAHTESMLERIERTTRSEFARPAANTSAVIDVSFEVVDEPAVPCALISAAH